MTKTEHPDMPCGRCEVGTYSYAALFSPLARLLAEMPERDRKPPRCKTFDRDCVGACDFIDGLKADLDGWRALDESSKP